MYLSEAFSIMIDAIPTVTGLNQNSITSHIYYSGDNPVYM